METVELTIDGVKVRAANGTTVAAAVLAVGKSRFRTSVSGEPRTPMCGMGVCYECRVTIDGVMHSKSCQIAVREAMNVQTDEND